MEQRALGRSGLTVPVVGMGTWSTFDVRGARKEEKRREVVDAALAAGTTLFDTSPMYGYSPSVLGQALEGRRNQAIVADKVWTPSPADGREQIEQSLATFGGRVDIYQIHNLVAWREHLPVLENLRARGVVKVVGATHYKHAAMRELVEVMETGRIQQVQIPLNVRDLFVQREVLPLAAELGIGVLVMQPLATGGLMQHAPDSHAFKRLERFGVRTWAQALLKWILSDLRVHAVLPATSKPEHARENAAAGGPPWFDDEAREYVARL